MKSGFTMANWKTRFIGYNIKNAYLVLHVSGKLTGFRGNFRLRENNDLLNTFYYSENIGVPNNLEINGKPRKPLQRTEMKYRGFGKSKESHLRVKLEKSESKRKLN